VLRPLGEGEAVPFDTAEEAWLWYSSCQIARNEGVRVRADLGQVRRPCDPDDVYRAVIALYRRRRLADRHLAVLGRFGIRLAAPDPWAGDAPGEAALWAEALDRLATILKGKGIVA